MARTGRPRTVFLNSSSTYDDVHWILARDHGPAKTHKCKCGNPAYEWAYQHNGDTVTDERGRKFARDLDAYSPMCRSCHRLLDEKLDPGSLGERGKKGLKKQAAMLEADPSYGDARRASARLNAEKARAAAAADPEQRKKAAAAGRLGGLARAKKIRESRA